MIRQIKLALLSAAILFAQQPEVTFRSETRLVEAYASIFDKHGNPLPNLNRERFRVTDAGEPQSLIAFEGAEDPLNCALLLDITGSMGQLLPYLKNSVVHFLDEMREGETVAVYTFNTTLKVNQEFTTDKKALKQAVMRTVAGGSTALFDSISKVSHDLEQRKGKKALVVFTDGDDNSSTLSATAASSQARRSGVPIYIIAEGEALTKSKLLSTLDQLASDTGGVCFRLSQTNKMGQVFGEISRNLEHTYLLAWKLPEGVSDAWRPIRVTVAGAEGAIVRVRQGYWPR